MSQSGVPSEVGQEDLIPIGKALAGVARSKPNEVAVRFRDEAITWRDLDRRANRSARALEARGVKLGDFVTIAYPNGIAFIEACYACWKMGAVPQPVSSRLPLSELKAIVELANAPLVFAATHMDLDRPIVTIEELLAQSADESDLPDRISPSWKAPTSGGSTGRPKLIVSGQPGVTGGIAATADRA
jgi:bile acid-coenzyme A ligase